MRVPLVAVTMGSCACQSMSVHRLSSRLRLVHRYPKSVLLLLLLLLGSITETDHWDEAPRHKYLVARVEVCIDCNVFAERIKAVYIICIIKASSNAICPLAYLKLNLLLSRHYS